MGGEPPPVPADEAPTQPLVGDVGDTCAAPARRLLDGTSSFCASLAPRQSTVLSLRLASPTPASHAHVASVIGTTGEWARQLHNAVLADLRANAAGLAESLAEALHGALGAITETETLTASVAGLLPGDDLGAVTARYLLDSALTYDSDGTLSADADAGRYAAAVRSEALRSCDDVGIISEEDLFDAVGASGAWAPRHDALLARCGLWRINDGFVTLRDTTRARAKAALSHLRRPATSAEVAQQCGISHKAAMTSLSAIGSVARFDKDHWALRDHCTDVYEGLPQQMARHIDDAGGRIELDELASSLAATYRVKEASVRKYARSPMFSRDGAMISVAERPMIERHALSDAVTGVDGDGVPYWEFVATPRALANLGLTGMPRAVAVALGCPLGGRTMVAISEPPGCPDVLVTSRLASWHGASLRQLGEPLRILGAAPGNRVCLRVEGEQRASMRLAEPSEA